MTNIVKSTMQIEHSYTLDPSALQAIKFSALKAFPGESCGFVWGVTEGKNNKVLLAREVNNIRPLAERHLYFEIDPKAYMEAEKFAEQNQIALMGVFHSHPNQAAIPSNYDHIAAFPNFLYIIVSLVATKINEIRCWQLGTHERLEELTSI